MIRAVHSLLIVTLLLTGLALGAARGQARIAGAVVICAGNAVTVMTVDENGNPVEAPHFCPDMALSLLAAVAVPNAAPLRVATASEAMFQPPPALGASRDAPTARARAPPFQASV